MIRKILFGIFYLILIETFVELMIKSMDMEKLDWKEPTSWQWAKVLLMASLFFIQAFNRWFPFLIISKFKNHTEDIFVSPIKFQGAPWFFFACIGNALLMLFFAGVIYKLNPNAWQLYLLLVVISTEIFLYLIIGFRFKLFTVVMGKNSLILSKGNLIIMSFQNIKSIETKYKDELYFVLKNGKVETMNFQLLEKKSMTEFIIRLKNNCDEHGIYLGNDVGKSTKI